MLIRHTRSALASPCEKNQSEETSTQVERYPANPGEELFVDAATSNLDFDDNHAVASEGLLARHRLSIE
jgi:hypothetical protein